MQPFSTACASCTEKGQWRGNRSRYVRERRVPQAGNILAVNLLARETPHGGGERRAMRAVARDVLTELHARGYHALTIADLHAIPVVR